MSLEEKACSLFKVNLGLINLHGIFQARILEWVVIPFSRDLRNPGIKPTSPVSPALQADSLPSESPGKLNLALYYIYWCNNLDIKWHCWVSFFLFFLIFLLYNIVLVLPYIDMNQPWVYTCCPSWTPLPPPSPSHASGSSQCTSAEHPVSCIESGLVIHFTCDNLHVSMPFSHIIPPSPSPTESKRLFYTSVSLLLSRIWWANFLWFCISVHHFSLGSHRV